MSQDQAKAKAKALLLKELGELGWLNSEFKAEDFLLSIIDALPEEIMVIDQDYSIALANRLVLEKLGREKNQAMGNLTCHQVSHGNKQPCTDKMHLCPLKEVFRTKSRVEVEHIHLDRKGNEVNVEVSASPIFDDMGEVKYVVKSCRDKSNRKQAEDEPLKMETQIQKAQKLKSLGVLAGGVAHDFNNLLTGVLGNVDLALMELPSESPVREMIYDIKTTAMQATELAKQMLAYSGKGQFNVRRLNLKTFVQETDHLLESVISSRVVLQYHFAETVPPIMADAVQVRQILINLVTNASEAIGMDSGRIAIRSGAMVCDHEYLSNSWFNDDLSEGLYSFIEVEDTGCGMAEETLSKIFDPFFTTKLTGRGLGLAAALGIIRGHKGAIIITSESGNGTTFKVLFPSAES
ncbi:MAG: PAS domain S-box protein [Proteobacteria bacterium]|nr:PAS domain S-box protein [Pseudomonadota bacterium]